MIEAGARKLAEALRSGEYTQIIGSLRGILTGGADGFCCLGVACEISGLSEWKPHTSACTYPDSYIGRESDLPARVQVEYEFHSQTGCRRDGRNIEIKGETYPDLATANDQGVTFDDIADYIDKYWEEL